MILQSVLILAATVVAPQENPNPWELAEQGDRLKVYARPVPGSPIREVKAVAVFYVEAKQVWDVLMDVERYPEFMPYVKKTLVIERFDGGLYEYQLIDPPLVDSRDYAIKITLEEDAAKGLYFRRWEPANHKAPKLPGGVVRVEINRGYWQVKSIGKEKTEVTYYVFTNPGGAIPNWIANKANSESVPDLMHAMRKRSANPRWRP